MRHVRFGLLILGLIFLSHSLDNDLFSADWWVTSLIAVASLAGYQTLIDFYIEREKKNE